MQNELPEDWMKRLKTSDVVKYRDEDELHAIWDHVKFAEFPDPMPRSMVDSIIEKVSNLSQMVNKSGNPLRIATEEEFQSDLNADQFQFHLIVISVKPVEEDGRKLTTYEFVEMVVKNLAELFTMIIDKLSISGNGQAKFLGLVPTKINQDDPTDLSKSILDLVTFVDKTDTDLSIHDLIDVQKRYLSLLKIDPDSDEAKKAIAKAKWYCNMQTGLTFTYLQEKENPVEEIPGVTKIYAPAESILGSKVVYNSYMNNIDNRPNTTWQVVESNLTPLIYGDLEGVYDLSIYPNIHGKNIMLNSPKAGIESEISFGAMMRGTVNTSKLIDGKLPYVSLNMILEPRTDDELDEGDKAAERVQQYYEIVHNISLDMTTPNEDWVDRAKRMSSLEGFPQ